MNAQEAVAALAGGRVTAQHLVESSLARIEALEPTFHAWAYLDRPGAMERARAIDDRLKAGHLPGPLGGVPVGVKDIFNTEGMPTQMGSSIWAGFQPGNDARVVHTLRQAGAVILGKTVTAEFAVHTPGQTLNPHDPRRTPGTSSSGSAAAVALGMVPVALGSQTAGSTIRPASYCGVYGLKPTYGLIPRTGMLKTTDTLDHVTFFTSTLADLALVWEVLRVRGENYPYAHRALPEAPFISAATAAGLKAVAPTAGRDRWRVGLVRSGVWVWEHTPAYARSSLEEVGRRLSDAGAQVEEARLPVWIDRIYELHERIYEKCLSYYFGEEYRNHPEMMSPTFRGMIEQGMKTSPEAYGEALEEQGRMTRAMEDLFDRYDLLLALSSAGEAPLGLEDTIRMDTCLVWTFCGVPALNVPLLTGPSGLPFGIQLIARRYADPQLFSFAAFLDQLFQGSQKDFSAAGALEESPRGGTSLSKNLEEGAFR